MVHEAIDGRESHGLIREDFACPWRIRISYKSGAARAVCKPTSSRKTLSFTVTVTLPPARENYIPVGGEFVICAWFYEFAIDNGEPAEISFSRMPMARRRRVTTAP